MSDTKQPLDYRAIDVDNHYYEPVDSFTRHLPKEFKRRGVQMLTEGKRTFAVMGGEINQFIPNPTFDPIIEPGCLDLLFRGEIPEGVDPASLMKVDRMANHPEYQNRDARVKVLDRQNLETVFMLPTFACGVEEALKHDIEATMASVHAFNLWLDEDWGFDRPDHRFISAPIISLADLDKAIEEVEFVLARGAKMVLVRPAPVPGVVKPRSLGDPLHDPVWARLAEAGVPVGFHLSDSGYLAIAALWGGKAKFEGFGKKDPLDQILLDDRAIHDTMASMVVHQVFTRHPKLKVASIENGSYFVHRLIKRLKKAANSAPHHFTEDPVEQIRNNVWIAPYYEDDVQLLAETIGVDKILFGSDWPHGEGLADPMTFTADIPQFPLFSAEDTRKVMRDNALDLLGGGYTPRVAPLLPSDVTASA
jgi:predicted TIM-barrel fold metal-dependent hydrolase